MGGVAAVLAVYAVASWLVLWPLPLASATRLPTCACGDEAQQAWFLALAKWSVSTGHISALTDKIWYPTGLNLLDNASNPLLSVLATPVTALVGPIATLDLLYRLAFLISAAACFLALRRLVKSTWAAAVGGALYGFSPYMRFEGGWHLFASFVPLPPLMLLVVYEQLTAESGGRWGAGWPGAVRRGVLLAAMAVVQFFLSSEVLLATAVTLVAVLVVVAVLQLVHPTRLAAPARALGRLSAVTVILGGAVLAYPTWYSVAGPLTIDYTPPGATVPGVDWSSTLWPVDRNTLAGYLPGPKGSAAVIPGSGGLIGLILIAVAVATVVIYRRRILVQAAAVLVAGAWVISLGSHLVRGGKATATALPWDLFDHSVLRDLEAGRFSLYVYLGLAVLVAVAIEGLLGRLNTRQDATATNRAVPLLGLVAIAAGLVYIAPMPPIATRTVSPTPVVVKGALASIPNGGVVLAYPFPRYPEDMAMVWQMQTGMRFSLLGGYGLQPHVLTVAQERGERNSVQTAFMRAWSNGSIVPTLLAKARAYLPTLVHDDHITTIVVDTSSWSLDDGVTKVTPGSHAQPVVALVTRVYGSPRHYGPLDVWNVSGG
jgi:hypothetical protein